jgi:hypothetical protein
MGLLDTLLGRPTLKGLVKEAERWIVARGLGPVTSDLEAGEMRAGVGAKAMRISLGNLWHAYERAAKADRAQVIDQFLSAVLPGHEVPATYADARPRLLPVVRCTSGVGIMDLARTRHGPSDPAHRVASRPLAADLHVALVVDTPNAMSYVTDGHVAGWGLSFEQAMADALDNLRSLPGQGGWRQITPGVWSGEWGDTYESSRLLLPDVVYRSGVSQPVVLAPFRNTLLVTARANTAGIEAMLNIAASSMEDNARWLSFQPLELHEGQWRPAQLEGAAAALARELDLRSLAGDFATQKQMLDGSFKEQNVDVFVATFQLMRKDDGPVLSMAVWSEGVDTLLPEADFVTILHDVGVGNQHSMLPWPAVRERFADLIEATDHVPVRYRVRATPPREAVVALEAELAACPAGSSPSGPA